MIGRMGKLLLLLYYLSDAQIFLGSYSGVGVCTGPDSRPDGHLPERETMKRSSPREDSILGEEVVYLHLVHNTLNAF